MKSKVYENILVLSDLHFPFADWDAIEQAHKWAKKNEPDLVVITGDLLDQKAWSRFESDADDYSPQQEFDKALQDVKRLEAMFPECHIIFGNHDLRIAAKVTSCLLPKQLLREFEEIFDCKGWTWYANARDKVVFETPTGPVYFHHGDESKFRPMNLAMTMGMSNCSGHTHKAEILHRTVLDKTLWSMEAGCLMDPLSKGARYAAANPVGISIGFGTIVGGNPCFHPKKVR